MKPTVSIICPIRNEEKYIVESLQSLVNQTYQVDEIEILVVDGMSEDRTREIVHSFQSRFKNIKLIDNPKEIVPTALNIGIRAAHGKYILRIDGHAKAAPDYVEKCIEALESERAEGVGGPIMSVNNTDTGKAIAVAMSSTFGVGNSKFRTSNDECFVDSLAFPSYKREVFTKFGFFDEELVRCQDDEFNFRIRKLGGKILLTPDIKSWYFSRDSFKKLWKQYFGYGFWKVRILQKHFWMMQLRHFIPAAFIFSLAFFLLFGFYIPKGHSMFLFIASIYILTSTAAAGLTWLRCRQASIHKILLTFFILHFSYGSGFLFGLIKFLPNWFAKKESLKPIPSLN